MLDQLFRSLYQALSRDPLPVPALNLTLLPLGGQLPASYVVELRDDVLYGTAQSAGSPVDPAGTVYSHPNLAIDLLDIDGQGARTLGDLVTKLNTTPGFQATLSAGTNPALWAVALVDGITDVMVGSQTLTVYGSVLWALLKPIAYLLRRAHQEFSAGTREIQPLAADGDWLDSLGDLYGVRRIIDPVSGAPEGDNGYRTRLYYEVLEPRTNNVALQEYLKWSFGFAAASVVDDPLIAFKFNVILSIDVLTGLGVHPATIGEVVNRIKAWGTVWALVFTAEETETARFADGWHEAFTLHGNADTWDDTFQELLTTLIASHRFESARVPKPYLVTNAWHRRHGQPWLSQTNTPGSLLHDLAQGYRSWVLSFLDAWYDKTGPYRATDTWNLLGAASTHLALGFYGIPERMRQTTESRGAALSGRRQEQSRARWPVLRTDTRLARLSERAFHASAAHPTTTLTQGAAEVGSFSIHLRS